MRKVLAIALFVSLLVTVACAVPAVGDPPALEFTFRTVAVLGDAAPQGGTFVFDFEPYALNNRGEVGFGADLQVGGLEIGEGIFIRRHQGDLVEVARAGAPTPEGATTFGASFFERTPLNARGDLAFTFEREPVTEVPGVNAGVYRFTRQTGLVTPVMLPGEPAPGGGAFAGATSHASLNNRGDIAFAGLVTDADIDPGSPPGIDGLGVGVFVRDRTGRLARVVRPGDPAPGGKVFDFVDRPSINDHGDVGFAAHVGGDACIFGDQVPLFCAESVYVKTRHGEIRSLAHQGEPAPGGGVYRWASRPVLNNRGEIAFVGDLTPAPDVLQSLGVFLFTKGEVLPIARPGDALPGGGALVTASALAGTHDLNERGDVTFAAHLVRDGLPETGVYLWSRGALQLVVKTGTQIPGVGTIVQLQPPDVVGDTPRPWVGGAVNDHRQVVFVAAVDNGLGGARLGILLLADPTTSD